MPAYGAQEKLDHALAALSVQSYPQSLLEVVVADDGSDPPLRLPEIRPEHCRVITTPDEVWGSAAGTNAGVAASDGQVILRLDADMLVWREHIESQMRWHHLADYLVVLGHKRFVDYRPGQYTPEQVHYAVASGEAAGLFDPAEAKPQWIESVIERTDGLKRARWRNVANVFVGASASFPRTLFERAGGFDSSMPLGSDTDFGHRLVQAGAAFVPDDDTSSWHLGVPEIKARTADGNRYRSAFFLQRLPEHRSRRQAPRVQFDVPSVDIVIDVDEFDLERIDSRVRPLLDGARSDIRITLVAPWPDPSLQRAVVADDELEAKVVQAYYGGEARVAFAAETPPAHHSTPFRLELPLAYPATTHTVSRLTGAAEKHNVGTVELPSPDGTARLVRRSAAARADHLGVPVDEVAESARLAPEAEAPKSRRRPNEVGRLARAYNERRWQPRRVARLSRHVRYSPTWLLHCLRHMARR
ncbi:glycosyltransferase [Glycomyces xiaoerkulensis]|uniref:glycosyltransferase n=1 Tax=Glycomyces xiaoerkulensis TaxID=2038139 RepID=UPI0018E445F6|nr:glycosyltransferase [Glycomyces xiaoerkulensis]